MIALFFSKYIPIAIIYNFTNQQKNNFSLLKNFILYCYILPKRKKRQRKIRHLIGKKYVGGLL